MVDILKAVYRLCRLGVGIDGDLGVDEAGPSEEAYLKLSPSEAEFGSKSSELS